MAAGTNTTSCTSSRGRSEFLAKITAGRAEAGGTEEKQSQEHGVSGLHDAIWGEMGMRVSLSSTFVPSSPGNGPREHPSQHVQTLGEDPETGVRRTAPHACSLLGVREGNAHSLHGAPGLGIGRRAQTARSEGPALLGNMTLQGSRRSASLATQPLSKSPKPLFCRPFSRSPNTLCSSPSLRANPQLSPESYSLRFR